MMPTYRDLAMPGRGVTWRALRGLRADPPGAAASDKDREKTFQTALEQVQQLMEAAEDAGHATRPIQVFYALSQAGRAIAAVSTRLPSTRQIPDRSNPGAMVSTPVDWKLKGHGITAPGTNVKRVGLIVVRADWTGLLPGVAMALGVPCLAPEEKIKVGDLWPLIWETRRPGGSLVDDSELPALYLAGGSRTGVSAGSAGLFTARLSGIPDSVRSRIGTDQTELSSFLDRYPSLNGWAHRPFSGVSAPIDWEHDGSIKLTWTHPDTLQQQGVLYRGHDLLAMPRIGSTAGPLDPFIAWWAVLFALSMMARYEPSHWAGMIDINSSKDANAIEHLLDQALDAVPHLVLEAIGTAAP
jgi:hypothetical protein